MKNFKIFIVEFNAIKVRQRIKEGKRKIKEISEKTTKCLLIQNVAPLDRMKKSKELSCFQFSNHYIFASGWLKSLIFQT